MYESLISKFIILNNLLIFLLGFHLPLVKNSGLKSHYFLLA